MDQQIDDSAAEDGKAKSPADKYLINYSVKYGSQVFNWVEQNCAGLHKGKELHIDYRLGQADQTVSQSINLLPPQCSTDFLPFRSIGASDADCEVNARGRPQSRHLQQPDRAVSEGRGWIS